MKFISDDCLDSVFADDDNSDDDDDGGVVVVDIRLPRKKNGNTLEKKDQEKRVLTFAYNACALKFNAQRRLAVMLRGKNAKVPQDI
jgi:hypothetical protein